MFDLKKRKTVKASEGKRIVTYLKRNNLIKIVIIREKLLEKFLQPLGLMGAPQSPHRPRASESVRGGRGCFS